MLLTNARILTMEAADIPCGFVQIEGEKIAAVGSMDELPQSAAGERMDLSGKTLAPGFVDAHSHQGIFSDGIGPEGEDANEFGDPCTPHVRALDAINPLDRCFEEARAAGVTTVVVSPGSANPLGGEVCALKTHGCWLDKMVIRAPLAMKLAFGENPKMIWGEKSQTPATRMAIAAMIREQFKKAQRYQQDKERAEKEEEAPPDFDMRLEALLPALRAEMRVHIHAHKAYDILTGVRIAKEFGLKYTLVHCTEGHEIADILAELGADVICGPLLGTRTKPELAHFEMDNCAKLMQAGVRVAICTDHPEVPVRFLPLSAELAAAHGAPPRAVLEAITIHAACVVDLQDRIGSIKAGKDADLLVFDTDPLAPHARPEQVWISGRRVG